MGPAAFLVRLVGGLPLGLGIEAEFTEKLQFRQDVVLKAGMEIELSELLGGQKVDLRTSQDLIRYFRDEAVAGAEVQYAEG
jgi:hypothetical protein